MANEKEPAKLLLPYLQRADELQKHEPLVAYYCRLYAMERGLKIPQSERTKTTNSLLVSLMKQLEKDKKSLNLGPDDNLHLEGFALNVFSKADKQDRAGRADLNTAKTFYAASIFFEILNQFGEVQPDLEQKQKYAAWKASDIRKALKEGRKPVAGPPGGEEDLSIPLSTISSEYELESSQSDPATRFPPESESLPESYDKVNRQPPENLYSASLNIPPSPPSNMSSSPPNMPSSTSKYPTDDYPLHNIHPTSGYLKDAYPSHNMHQTSPASRSENSAYSQPYQHHSFPLEPQQHLPHNYPHEMPSNSYPNFQSYPSFSESSLPAVPPHYSSYYQGSDASYPNLPGAGTTNYPSTTQYNPSSGNGSVLETAPSPTQTYQYDINYQPSPDKIAEAHKAARFAVGALAFDDVYVAVDYLKKSLELLTNPSAGN